MSRDLDKALAAFDVEFARARALEADVLRLRAALAPFAGAYDGLRPAVQQNLMRNVCAPDTCAVIEVRALRGAAEALTRRMP